MLFLTTHDGRKLQSKAEILQSISTKAQALRYDVSDVSDFKKAFIKHQKVANASAVILNDISVKTDKKKLFFYPMNHKPVILNPSFEYITRTNDNFLPVSNLHVLDIEMVSAVKRFMDYEFRTEQEVIDYLISRGLTSFLIVASSSRAEAIKRGDTDLPPKFHVYVVTDKPYTQASFSNFIKNKLMQPYHFVNGLNINGGESNNHCSWCDMGIYKGNNRLMFELSSFKDAKIIGNGKPFKLTGIYAKKYTYGNLYTEKQKSDLKKKYLENYATEKKITVKKAREILRRFEDGGIVYPDDTIFLSKKCSGVTVQDYMDTNPRYNSRIQGFHKLDHHDVPMVYRPLNDETSIFDIEDGETDLEISAKIYGSFFDHHTSTKYLIQDRPVLDDKTYIFDTEYIGEDPFIAKEIIRRLTKVSKWLAFMSPTGTGKTELARMLAKMLIEKVESVKRVVVIVPIKSILKNQSSSDLVTLMDGRNLEVDEYPDFLFSTYDNLKTMPAGVFDDKQTAVIIDELHSFIGETYRGEVLSDVIHRLTHNVEYVIGMSGTLPYEGVADILFGDFFKVKPRKVKTKVFFKNNFYEKFPNERGAGNGHGFLNFACDVLAKDIGKIPVLVLANGKQFCNNLYNSKLQCFGSPAVAWRLATYFSVAEGENGNSKEGESVSRHFQPLPYNKGNCIIGSSNMDVDIIFGTASLLTGVNITTFDNKPFERGAVVFMGDFARGALRNPYSIAQGSNRLRCDHLDVYDLHGVMIPPKSSLIMEVGELSSREGENIYSPLPVNKIFNDRVEELKEMEEKGLTPFHSTRMFYRVPFDGKANKAYPNKWALMNFAYREHLKVVASNPYLFDELLKDFGFTKIVDDHRLILRNKLGKGNLEWVETPFHELVQLVQMSNFTYDCEGDLADIEKAIKEHDNTGRALTPKQQNYADVFLEWGEQYSDTHMKENVYAITMLTKYGEVDSDKEPRTQLRDLKASLTLIKDNKRVLDAILSRYEGKVSGTNEVIDFAKATLLKYWSDQGDLGVRLSQNSIGGILGDFIEYETLERRSPLDKNIGKVKIKGFNRHGFDCILFLDDDLGMTQRKYFNNALLDRFTIDHNGAQYLMPFKGDYDAQFKREFKAIFYGGKVVKIGVKNKRINVYEKYP